MNAGGEGGVEPNWAGPPRRGCQTGRAFQEPFQLLKGSSVTRSTGPSRAGPVRCSINEILTNLKSHPHRRNFLCTTEGPYSS